jgi:hypothetical protein
MRMLRLSAAGAVAVVLLGGLGAAALAQEEYSHSGAWIRVLAAEDCWSGSPTEYVEQDSGDYQVRGIPVGCEVTNSDARLDGTLTLELVEDCFVVGGCVNWGPVEVVGPDGSWSGWYTGIERPDAHDVRYTVMTGTGAYQGLTHIRHSAGPFGGPYEEHGVVYEGDPPPMLDVAALVAEPSATE